LKQAVVGTRRTLRRTAAPFALVAVLAAPGPAAAETTLAREGRATSVSAYGGRVAWSTWDGRARAYRLVAHSGGRKVRLPVRPRPVPFDVDLGPGPGGGAAAVYSRCRTEPDEVPDPRTELPAYTTGRGCDLYRYDFRSRRESKIARSLPGASEVLPTIWRGNVAFARVYERRRGVAGLRAHLYHGSLSSRRSPRELAGGTPGRWEDVNFSGKGEPDYVGGDALVALDLAGRRIAFVWAAAVERCEPDEPPDDLFPPERSEVWLARVDGGGRELVEYGCDGDETDYFLSPSFAGDRLFYYRRLNVQTPGGRFRTFDLGARAFAESAAGERAKSIAQDGTTTYYSLTLEDRSTRVVRDDGLVFEPSQRSANR
jgi:hypothetical protein